MVKEYHISAQGVIVPITVDIRNLFFIILT